MEQDVLTRLREIITDTNKSTSLGEIRCLCGRLKVPLLLLNLKKSITQDSLTKISKLCRDISDFTSGEHSRWHGQPKGVVQLAVKGPKILHQDGGDEYKHPTIFIDVNPGSQIKGKGNDNVYSILSLEPLFSLDGLSVISMLKFSDNNSPGYCLWTIYNNKVSEKIELDKPIWNIRAQSNYTYAAIGFSPRGSWLVLRCQDTDGSTISLKFIQIHTKEKHTENILQASNFKYNEKKGGLTGELLYDWSHDETEFVIGSVGCPCIRHYSIFDRGQATDGDQRYDIALTNYYPSRSRRRDDDPPDVSCLFLGERTPIRIIWQPQVLRFYIWGIDNKGIIYIYYIQKFSRYEIYPEHFPFHPTLYTISIGEDNRPYSNKCAVWRDHFGTLCYPSRSIKTDLQDDNVTTVCFCIYRDNKCNISIGTIKINYKLSDVKTVALEARDEYKHETLRIYTPSKDTTIKVERYEVPEGIDLNGTHSITYDINPAHKQFFRNGSLYFVDTKGHLQSKNVPTQSDYVLISCAFLNDGTLRTLLQNSENKCKFAYMDYKKP